MSEQQPPEQIRVRKKRYRKKKRWPKVLLWTLSIVVILGAGGLFAANYAIDKFLEQMAAEIDFGDITADAGGEQATGNNTPVGGGGSGDGDSSEGGAVTDGTATPGTSKGTGADGASGGKPSNNPAPTTPEDLDGYSAEVTPDKAQHVQDNVTLGDKSKVLSIIMGQLSVEDIKRLQELASGGLTVEEKKEARALMLEKLTEEQYDEIIAVATKHGLSTGKSYGEQTSSRQ
ncbi:hypothetical protein [Paenibacillus daejeonensis]|uniref:hypothetical protein n=1 Tax=Paenibacillus daejeonensis TaxID=135193 RepID=UPI000374582B|nr:hypothetical protein [Paenibacillus daejeonensis]